MELSLCFPQLGLRASRGNDDCKIIPSNIKTNPKIVAVALLTGGALAGLSSCQRQQESALKPIDKAALPTLVDTTAKELLIPGVVVLLRTTQGEFAVSYGTTLLELTAHRALTPTSGSRPIPRP
jgi:hypothetical protein